MIEELIRTINNRGLFNTEFSTPPLYKEYQDPLYNSSMGNGIGNDHQPSITAGGGNRRGLPTIVEETTTRDKQGHNSDSAVTTPFSGEAPKNPSFAQVLKTFQRKGSDNLDSPHSEETELESIKTPGVKAAESWANRRRATVEEVEDEEYTARTTKGESNRANPQNPIPADRLFGTPTNSPPRYSTTVKGKRPIRTREETDDETLNHFSTLNWRERNQSETLTPNTTAFDSVSQQRTKLET
jgi:hypothetical protein